MAVEVGRFLRERELAGLARERELGRRLIHASGAGLPALYLLGLLSWSEAQLAYLAGSALVLVLEVGRLLGRVDWWVYDRLTREYERDHLAGYALYMFSSMAVALAFRPRVALPALLILAIADPVSGLLGAGELRTVKRTSVLLVTFGVSTLIAAFFVPPAAAVAGGLAATLADGVKPVVGGYVLDDNLTIPPAAAVAIWATLRYLPAGLLG